MQRIVFFGKGGIGKSTVATNVSVALQRMGQRVLHVGCDPKHDSTVPLLGGRLLKPVVDAIESTVGLRPEDVVVRSPDGIDCVEAGGPEAGVGCGGRGITRMMEIFSAAKLLAPGRYDTAVYDVLGDVVCGGFAAPLRKGIGEKVVIVTSEEVMAMYAANNIAKAVCHYAENGIVLAGIIVNLRDNNEDRAPLERFAKLINAEILAWVPRDPVVREAEYRRVPVSSYAPQSAIAGVIRQVTERILDFDPKTAKRPTPLSEEDFYLYTQFKFAEPPRPAARVAETTLAEESGCGACATETPLVELRRSASDTEPVRAPSPTPAPAAASTPTPFSDNGHEASFRREWLAGVRAVQLGRVRPEEALRRLQERFPDQASRLDAREFRM
jgi:nitrogenase iron protein NifH